MLGRIRYQSLLPCFIAAILADRVTTLWGVHHTHYAVASIPTASALNLTAVVVAGAVFGLAGMVFSKGLQSLWCVHQATYYIRAPTPVVWRHRYCGSSLVRRRLAVRWFRTSSIVQAFEQPVAPWDFAAKMGLTIASLASGFKGGEVTPLFVGATLEMPSRHCSICHSQCWQLLALWLCFLLQQTHQLPAH